MFVGLCVVLRRNWVKDELYKKNLLYIYSAPVAKNSPICFESVSRFVAFSYFINKQNNNKQGRTIPFTTEI